MALPQISQALATAGINSLRFDFSGNGDSEGEMRFANFDGEVSDVAAAKQFLEEELQQEVTGLLGHSKGGGVVLLYAARYKDIPRVINVSGRFVMTEGLLNRFGDDIFSRLELGPVEVTARHSQRGPVQLKLTLEDVRERMAVDMAATCDAINKAGCMQVLTIHGTGDRTILVKDAHLFAEAITGSGLVLIEGADHNFTNPEKRQELVDAVVAYFSEAKESSS